MGGGTPATLDPMRKNHTVAALAVSTVLLLLSGCGSGSNAPTGPAVLKGAGATAPYLAYSKWAEAFSKSEPGVKVEYQAIGSGEGIKQLEAGTVDFAASDIPMTDDAIGKMNTKPMHFPMLISSIVPVFHVEGLKELQFSAETLAGIFSGKIKSWNDPALAKDNPGAALPSARIAVVRRSDESGSTYALTDFLSRASAAWKKEHGDGPSRTLPAGIEVKGSEAMVDVVRKTANAIGYVDLNYANAGGLSLGAVKNAAGKFQKASIETQGSALDAAQNMTKEFRGSIANAPGEKTYPICTLTWLIVPSEFTNTAKGTMMKRFLRWAYMDGQKMAMPMDYGILQPPLIDRVRDQVEAIKVLK